MSLGAEVVYLGIETNIFKCKTHLELMERSELVRLTDVDFPDVPKIDEETIKVAKRNSSEYRSSVRIIQGRFWTTQGYEKYREKVLSMRIP